MFNLKARLLGHTKRALYRRIMGQQSEEEGIYPSPNNTDRRKLRNKVARSIHSRKLDGTLDYRYKRGGLDVG